MNITKRWYQTIAGITMFILTMLASIVIFNFNSSSQIAKADAPAYEGTWVDNITTTNADLYDIKLKEYNAFKNGLSKETAWVIMTAEDLAYVSYVSRRATIGNPSTRYYYRLGADIDLAGKKWVPIGPAGTGYIYNYFHGAIDGTKTVDDVGNVTQTYKIKNMVIADEAAAHQGLISCSGGYNTFTNFDLENCYIQTSYSYVAGIASYVAGGFTLENVNVTNSESYISSSYNSTTYIASMIGYAHLNYTHVTYGSNTYRTDATALVKNCNNYASIASSGASGGGLVSFIDGANPAGAALTEPDEQAKQIYNNNVIFENCNNYGDIEVATYVGGIVGRVVYGKFIDCNNYGDVITSTSSTSHTGGIAGRAYFGAKFDNCHNYARVEGTVIGGILGYTQACIFDMTFNNCHNEGYLSGTEVGGIMGQRSVSSFMQNNLIKASFIDCFNIGELDTATNAAGIIGYNQSDIEFVNCYNSADIVNVTTGRAGGIIGLQNNGVLKIDNCYNAGDLIVQLNSYVGGLVAQQTSDASFYNTRAILTNSYNLGEIAGKDYAGGLIGAIRASFYIEKCFNMGDVQGNGTATGGLIGHHDMQNYFNDTSCTIKQSFNSGISFSGAVSYVGGLIGYTLVTNGAVTYDDNKSAVNYLIEESFNTVIIEAASYAGGLIGRFTFNYDSTLTEWQISLTFNKSFGLNNEENSGVIAQIGNPARGHIIYDYRESLVSVSKGINPETGEEIFEDELRATALSRMLSVEEFSSRSTFENIKKVDESGNFIAYVSYDFVNIWKMADPENSGVSTYLYLKDSAGFTLRLVVEGKSDVYYEAVLNEEFIQTEFIEGYIFKGWETEQSGGTLYSITDQLILDGKITTLYAVFEKAEYYRIILEGETGGSLEATYTTTSNMVNGFTLTADGNYSFVFTLNDYNDTSFYGWQIWKGTSETDGKWTPLVSRQSKSFNLLTHLNVDNIDEYLVRYDQAQTEGTEDQFNVVGFIKIRAAKEQASASFRAQIDLTLGEGEDAHLVGSGTLKYGNNFDARLNGEIIASFVQGTSVALIFEPNAHYEVKYVTITETTRDSGGNETTLAAKDYTRNVNNNTLTYEVGANVVDFIVTVRYEKIFYEVVINTLSKDGVTSLDDLSLVQATAADFVVLDTDMNIDLQANLTKDDGDVRYKFVGYKIYNQDERSFEYISKDVNLVINYISDLNFLNKYYGANKKITIIVEYAETFAVMFNEGVGGAITKKFVNPDTGEVEIYDVQTNYFFQKGTSITLSAAPGDDYNFSKFIVNSSELTTSVITFDLTKATTVTVEFAYKMYKIIINAEDSLSKQKITTNFSVDLDIINGEDDFVRLNSSFSLREGTNPEGYRFSHFVIKSILNPMNDYISGEMLDVDSTFLTRFLTLDNQIIVSAVYVKQYTLYVILPSDSTSMGDYEVRYWDNTLGRYVDAEDTRVFDSGTMLEIEAFAKNNFYTFVDFTNLSQSDKYISDDNKIARITLTPDKTVQIKFEKTALIVNSVNNVDGDTTDQNIQISKTDFTIGDKITILVTTGAGQEIKDWKINDVSINDLNSDAILGEYIEIKDNTVTITMSYAWLNRFGVRLDSEVSTGLSGGILGIIVAVGVIVPTLITVFIVFFVLNAKKKKIITAELKADAKANYQRNTSSFIQDLKEGKNVGKVTEADVKAEMKRRKKEGKNKK